MFILCFFQYIYLFILYIILYILNIFIYYTFLNIFFIVIHFSQADLAGQVFSKIQNDFRRIPDSNFCFSVKDFDGLVAKYATKALEFSVVQVSIQGKYYDSIGDAETCFSLKNVYKEVTHGFAATSPS